MAFNYTEKYYAGNNILASEVGLVLKTFEGTQAMATVDGDKKIIKAGTVVPTNDASAKGIVFEDVDMTHDAKRPISVIVAGRIKSANLPVAIDDAAAPVLAASGIVVE